MAQGKTEKPSLDRTVASGLSGIEKQKTMLVPVGPRTQVRGIDLSGEARPAGGFWGRGESRALHRRHGVLLAVAAVVVLTILLSLFARSARTPRSESEPVALGPTPIDASFGFGEGVTYPHPDSKAFELELISTAPAVCVLHFQSRDIAPADVLIQVNDQTVATVPADSARFADVFQRILLPSSSVKRGEKNQVVFKSTRNPPERRNWRIWNVSVEELPLPDLPPDQLVLQADASFGRAEQSFSRRHVAAVNRYLAWRDYRAAWLMLEAHPDPKPDLYWLTKDKLLQAQGELDRACAKLRLEILSYASQKQWEWVRATAEQVHLYFPNGDQPCRALTERTLSNLKW